MRTIGALATTVIIASVGLLSRGVVAQCENWSLFGDRNTLSYGDFTDFTLFNGQLVVCGELSGGDVKRWNGVSWDSIGSLPYHEYVYCMAVYNGELCIGGSFVDPEKSTPVNGVYHWNGTNWLPFGEGVIGDASVMTVYKGDLLVGAPWALGLEGVQTRNIARWDGTHWQFLPGGVSLPDNPNISSMMEFNGELIVGGKFDHAGDVAAVNVAAWDGRSWRALGQGLPGGYGEKVTSLAIFEGSLIAGFAHFNQDPSGHAVFKWDGTNWIPFGDPFGDSLHSSHSVYDMAVFNGDLVVSGDFWIAGGRWAINVARWDGTMWRELGSGLGEVPWNLVVFEGDLIAAQYYDDIFRWHDPPGECMGACCYQNECTITTFEACDAAGGLFHGAGVACDQVICPGQCETWQPMDRGLSYGDKTGRFAGYAMLDGKTIAVGYFIIPGQAGWKRVAAWDGETWTAVENGLNEVAGFGEGTAVLSEGDQVFIAGGGAVARWENSTWNPVGLPFSGEYMSVRSLILFRGELIAAGRFTTNGSQIVNGIARWDGMMWLPLGSGISGEPGEGVPNISSLAIYNDELIAAGRFANAGGKLVNNIAAWNGTSWRALDTGLMGNRDYSASVNCLAVFDGLLVAGGWFYNASGDEVQAVVAWDGQSWRSTFGAVDALSPRYLSVLAIHQGRLFAGGGWNNGSFDELRYWDADLKLWRPFSGQLRGTPGSLYSNGQHFFVASGELYGADSPGAHYHGPIIQNVAYWSECLDSCRSDVNGDRTVNAEDIMFVINAWGECSNPSRCPADIVRLPPGNGVVNVDDLLAVINGWGPCP